MFTTITATRDGERVNVKIECGCGTTTESFASYESFWVVVNELTKRKKDWGLNFSCSNSNCDKVYIVKSDGSFRTKKYPERLGPY